MVVDDLTLLPIVGNGGEGPYFITYYWEGWWTTFFIIHYGEWCWITLRYYPVWRMMVNDLTLLPIIGSYYLLLGMVVDDLALLNIVGNGGEGPYFITYYFEGWWKTLRYYQH